MGESGIVPLDFANEKLVEMAKYRNRLVHFYAEISSEEIYKILTENLTDIEFFLAKIKELLASPQTFNLEV